MLVELSAIVSALIHKTSIQRNLNLIDQFFITILKHERTNKKPKEW